MIYSYLKKPNQLISISENIQRSALKNRFYFIKRYFRMSGEKNLTENEVRFDQFLYDRSTLQICDGKNGR